MRYLFSFSPPWRAYAIRPYSFWRKTFLIGDFLSNHANGACQEWNEQHHHTLCSDGCVTNFHIRRHGRRMRYAPTVFGGRLFLLGSSFTPCERNLARIERTGVGAYRIRPPHWRTTPSCPLCSDGCVYYFIFAAVEGVCDTPLQFLTKYFSYWESTLTPCERNLPSIERTGVGAYRIRPSHERTTSSGPFAWNDALTIFIFAAVEGVCDTPLQFLAEDFSFCGLHELFVFHGIS